MDIHKDVTSAIYNFQLNALIEKNPSDLMPEEVIECFTSGMMAMHKKYEHLSSKYEDVCEKYIELANRVLIMQKDQSRERRIVNLFLKNNGLDDYDYDNFESRILRKLFEIQDSKEAQPHEIP